MNRAFRQTFDQFCTEAAPQIFTWRAIAQGGSLGTEIPSGGYSPQ